MTDQGNRSFPVLTSFEDDATLARKLSDEIAECLRQAVRARGQARIVLSGGATPQKTYLFLSKEDVPWDRVEITLADERWIPSSHPRSNHCLLNMTLFEPLAVKPKFIPLYRDVENPESVIEEINETLSQISRPFDLVLLGMGHDGHTASLFPDGDSLAEALNPDDNKLARVITAPEAQEPCVTLTLRAFLDSRRIILAFSGIKKFQTFERVMEYGDEKEMPIRAVLNHATSPVDVFYALGEDYGKTGSTEAAWKELKEKGEGLSQFRITDLFARDDQRFSNFSVESDRFVMDYSKTKIDRAAKETLIQLAQAAGVEQKRDAMFAGLPINTTENRAVGHVALRSNPYTPFLVGGRNVMREVKASLDRMRDFSQKIREGSIVSSSGERFTDIVNIGIGGSDLGPSMVGRALQPYCKGGPRSHFVSNVDGSHIADTLEHLDAKTTLIIISSKTFKTVETLTNAKTAKQWLIDNIDESNIASHCVAISSANESAKEFGISEDRIFGYWDWVGGRYSVWGPVGLPVMIAIGPEEFDRFLAGAREMDEHFRKQPLDQNMPVMLGLVGVWHNNICGYHARAILPYDQRLEQFPAYIQQLDMESNGKSTNLDGESVDYNTGPIVWGEPGTNGQHAFYQLLHQGTQVIPAEFMVACSAHEDYPDHHEWLIANCLAQSEALMTGRTEEEALAGLMEQGMKENEARELARHKSFDGDRPSVTLMYEKLDPFTLGKLIALYEHRVFVEGCIWDVNSFDQWGVELGKEVAKEFFPYVKDRKSMEGEGRVSTASLLKWRSELLK